MSSLEPVGRHRPAHFPAIEVFNRSTAVFLTVCTKDRKPLLARSEIHDLLRGLWSRIPDWLVGNYIFMPDHLHLLCVPSGPEAPSLARWVRYWKSIASKSWPFPAEKPVWQLDFWDTQLRQREHYSTKWEYIRRNPVRQGLCQSPDEWEFAGEIFELTWHDPR